MSDCGNVKKVFVPTDEKKSADVSISTFGVTPTAIEKIYHFITKDNKNLNEYGLRVQVVRDGCSGNSYDIQLGRLDDAITAGDKIFKFEDVSVIIEKLSYMFVIGSQLDYVETLLMSGFQITNPNVKRSCSCGSSFSIK
mgnify:CR=1 FL=1